MDLIFFDLDGTLLNKSSQLSPFTLETLGLLNEKGIANTVATGRTMLSAKHVIGDHDFKLTHIYSNGVTLWDPQQNELFLENLLEKDEIEKVLTCVLTEGITPFINTVDDSHEHYEHIIFHPEPKHQVEHDLLENYFHKRKANLKPLEAFSFNRKVTNISMIGDSEAIYKMWLDLNRVESLVAYSGPAAEGGQYSWMDIHHKLANKGSAVQNLKKQLGASNVICFGDSENDISMFACADESYAPKNAKDDIKKLASSVIGHHHEDGVAHFLRERFSL